MAGLHGPGGVNSPVAPSSMYSPAQHSRALAGLFLTATLLTATTYGADAVPAAANPPAPAASAPRMDRVENATVKVFATVRYPDLVRPWTKQSPSEITGSGVVIEGKRILTNAHVVLYASQVQIQANQAGDKISATVEAIAPGIDLAVLKLDDESFFDTHAPLPRASTVPQIKDSVMVYGFPTGGTSLSITKGIVSRIDFTGYNFPVAGLRIQIDAAINPGNSGGPAVVDEKMIGLAFSHLGGGTENIGYIIPCEEIELFLQDIADGHYDGKPAMFDELQTLENPALRAFLKVDKSVHGIVVHRPFGTDPAYPLKEWDLITKIGDTPVDDQGMIQFGENLRVHFTYLVQQIAKDGKVPLTVVRAGREVPVELPVSPNRPMVIRELNGAYPSYFVYGPLVFSSASTMLISSLGTNANLLNLFTALGSPLLTRRGDPPAFPGEELVVVSSPFLPHKLAQGYSNPVAKVVKTVNGIPIKNLAHLVEVLRDCRDEFIAMEFYGREAEAPVFRRQDLLAATEEILNDNGIRSQGTPDTLAVWNAQPAK
jgi:S1-C subfamily serine protease